LIPVLDEYFIFSMCCDAVESTINCSIVFSKINAVIFIETGYGG